MKKSAACFGQMLFVRDEATKKTDVLSPAARQRHPFCKLMLQKPNVLVLDDPPPP